MYFEGMQYMKQYMGQIFSDDAAKTKCATSVDKCDDEKTDECFNAFHTLYHFAP